MKRIGVDLKQLRSWCLAALIFWSFLINGSLCLFVKHEWQSVKFIGKEIGLSAIRKDYIHEIWNARHGGVYVPVNEQDPSNSELMYFVDRDAVTSSGKKLTLINPAYMTRQIYQIEQEVYGISGHINSLHVISPENKADKWERKALLRFEQGAEDVAEMIKQDNKRFMRVMKPLITRKSCLQCHAEQGYKIGDIRGGISITVPVEGIVELFRAQFRTSALYHMLIYLIGIITLVIFYFQTGGQLIRRTAIERKLSVQGQHLHGIVDNISNGIAVYEACETKQSQGEFIVKSVNAAGRRIVQLDKKEEVAGLDIKDVFPGVVDSGLLDVLRRIVQTGEPEHFSVAETFIKKSKKSKEKVVCWLEYYVYKLPTGEIVAVYEDVTSRKLAKEQLLRKTEEWENTFLPPRSRGPEQDWDLPSRMVLLRIARGLSKLRASRAGEQRFMFIFPL